MECYQNEKSHTESRKEYPVEEKDVLLQELDASKEQHENLLKRYEELEAKSKADIKILVKEVKSLRNSQTELKRELSQTQKEKCEAEVVFLSAAMYEFIILTWCCLIDLDISGGQIKGT